MNKIKVINVNEPSTESIKYLAEYLIKVANK